MLASRPRTKVARSYLDLYLSLYLQASAASKECRPAYVVQRQQNRLLSEKEKKNGPAKIRAETKDKMSREGMNGDRRLRRKKPGPTLYSASWNELEQGSIKRNGTTWIVRERLICSCRLFQNWCWKRYRVAECFESSIARNIVSLMSPKRNGIDRVSSARFIKIEKKGDLVLQWDRRC